MSDPEVPRPERPKDVDDVVDSANAGLDAAAAAGADVPGGDAQRADQQDADAQDADAQDAETADADRHVDPDLAAFEAAEKEHPGTFATPELNAMADADGDETAVIAAPVHEESAMADAAYAAPDDTETRIVPSEPVPSGPIIAPVVQQQPIFVQAPEPPRERGNRGTAGGIGLIAAVAFAILYLGAILGLGALAGDVTGENIGQEALAPLMTWGFWVPVVVFFLGFWLLGAFINRGRWGLWVVFGIIVGAIAYGGHILGQLFEGPFWLLTAAEGAELVSSQLLAPLAIAAFVFARELTIWFGAWVARSGARKTELNAEAQREYERTLEAGPSLSR
ncbi:ABC transporter [Microbacterium sp. SD291]|uniref:ABC transporter n=1 Tax=Microbacterium sp. SD291 TaxID=2782007 RepID=UPI001A96F436|nr:ABC transporter [Microbacterium sp. SD291]MBO0980414.1 ABC transporter [Microbacterium sp. SD291]